MRWWRRSGGEDLLLAEVDLAKLGPFRESKDRYLVVWRGGVGPQYGLVLRYVGRRGDTVHVVHSSGFKRSGSMENFSEFIGEQIKARDPRAAGVLLSWHTEARPEYDELLRVYFEPSETGEESAGRKILVGEGGAVTDLARPQANRYGRRVFSQRLSPAEWGRILGLPPLQRFSSEEWNRVAEEVDPGRVLRDEVDAASEMAFADQMAFLKEHGLYE
ncbi:hypothetical protein [Tsukamurella ocularis]|uniref:hypothetical protein n=1 Tax=Tsukamurella ocularis TaxID=1970234 RepID=UPI002169415A|nr:hypothetical protein [Tsukamurella ocularis]MCS3853288.1 hypothetical protein [Tsukamurella ocularis]